MMRGQEGKEEGGKKGEGRRRRRGGGGVGITEGEGGYQGGKG